MPMLVKKLLKQNLSLEFYRNQNKDISILTESHTNHDQIHDIRNHWLGPIFFFLGESHRRIAFLLHPDHTDHTDSKGRLSAFKFTPCNDRVLCVYAPSGHRTRKQMTRGRFIEGLKNYMEYKNKGNENKIILGDFNCIMDKMDSDGGSKTQRIYRCRSNYALSKLIMDNGLEDLWRRENPDSS